MRISVIVSTYESSEYLRKALWGYACQTLMPDEIVVADDGSTASTQTVVAAARSETQCSIEHVWHPHNGFKKPAILNRAILTSTGEYLIFADGDCIPRSDFVAAHARRAARGRFLSGGVFRLPRALNEAIDRENIECGRVFDRHWLTTYGVETSRLSKIGAPTRLARLLSTLTTTSPTFNGHNSSAWRRDIERVNGFDERMVYGGLDRELGERLENSGVRGLGVRYEAVCVHLDHDRDYVSAEGLAANRDIRRQTRRRRSTWTADGLVKGARRPS
jgi:glycosyltransferase involved in cell wall biosynthesis